jgi:TetR/AcrR family transcriptional regulator
MNEELKEMQRKLKRGYIKNIARDLFFSKGYENTSIEEIAKQANISKTTLYGYVKSKEELFLSIHLEGMKLRAKSLKEEMEVKETGYEKILAFGKVYFNFYQQNQGYFKLHMFEDYNSIRAEKVDKELYREFDEQLNELIALVKSAFELGIKDSSLKDDLNIGYCDKFLAYNLRAMLNVALSPDKVKQLDENFDVKDFYFEYLHMFMAFIKNPTQS